MHGGAGLLFLLLNFDPPGIPTELAAGTPGLQSPDSGLSNLSISWPNPTVYLLRGEKQSSFLLMIGMPYKTP